MKIADRHLNIVVLTIGHLCQLGRQGLAGQLAPSWIHFRVRIANVLVCSMHKNKCLCPRGVRRVWKSCEDEPELWRTCWLELPKAQAVVDPQAVDDADFPRSSCPARDQYSLAVSPNPAFNTCCGIFRL